MPIKMTGTVMERIQASQIEVKRRRLLLFKPDNRCWDWSIKVPSTNAKKKMKEIRNIEKKNVIEVLRLVDQGAQHKR